MYSPPKGHVTQSLDKMEKLANNLNKDLGVTATPVEVSPGQWKLRVERVPPPPSLPELRQSLQDMHGAMLRGEQRKISLGVIGPEEAAKIKAKTNIDTLLCKRELDTSWIDHAFRRHGNEMTQGQLSITKQDFERYAEILLDPHHIEPTGKANTIQYSRRYPDGTVYVLEQQIKGNKLEFRTLWKQSLGGKLEPILIAAPATEEEE